MRCFARRWSSSPLRPKTLWLLSSPLHSVVFPFFSGPVPQPHARSRPRRSQEVGGFTFKRLFQPKKKKKNPEPLLLWKVSLMFVKLERFQKLQHKNTEKVLHPPVLHHKALLMKTQIKSFRRPCVITSFLSANK